MAKPEWGVKRICSNCQAGFYDLGRDPIICPKCATTYDPESVLRSRRARATPVDKEVEPAVAEDEAAEPGAEAEADETAEAAEIEDAETIEEAADDEDESELIEDTSELGEDDQDMAEVIEHIEDEER